MNLFSKIFIFCILSTASFAQIDDSQPVEREIFKVVQQMPIAAACEELHTEENKIRDCTGLQARLLICQHTDFSSFDLEDKSTIVAQFVVNYDGSVSDINHLRNKTEINLIPAIEKMNDEPYFWAPGKQRGSRVNVLYTMPYTVSKKTINSCNEYKLENPLPEKKQDVTEDFIDDNAEVQDSENNDEAVVEELPLFPGCDDEGQPYEERKKCADTQMLQFIYKTLRYPSEARENGVEGMAIVTFIVEKDGTISNFEMKEDIGGKTDKAIFNVLDAMNAQNIIWRPGYRDGVPARVRYTLPINFKLEGRKRKKRKKR